MNSPRVIVDANLAFKALVSNRGDLRRRLSPEVELDLFSPRFLIVEIFRHHDRSVRAAGLDEDKLITALHTLLTRLEFVNEVLIPLGTWLEAHRLCRDVDEKDTAYVALTLHLDGRLWTEDLVQKDGLKARGFDRFFEA